MNYLIVANHNCNSIIVVFIIQIRYEGYNMFQLLVKTIREEFEPFWEKDRC